jgi:threonine aldolase
MRQAGIIAAGALFALEHNVDRLADDHRHARLIAGTIKKTDGLELAGDEVDTNIVIFSVHPELATATQFIEHLQARGVAMLAVGPQTIRAVTHLDVTRLEVDQACEAIADVVEGAKAR